MMPIWYIVVMCIIALLAFIGTVWNMDDYKNAKRNFETGDYMYGRPVTLGTIENSRRGVRVCFIGLLLSPVWPMIGVVLAVIGFYKTARVVVGKD